MLRTLYTTANIIRVALIALIYIILQHALMNAFSESPGAMLRPWQTNFVADTLLPTQRFPRLPARATFVADTNFVSGTQKMFDFVQKHFVSATNVSQFAQPKKHHGQQCVRNNVSSFTRALTLTIYHLFQS